MLKKVLFGLAVAVSAVAMACGGSDDNDSDAPSSSVNEPTATRAATTQATTIPIPGGGATVQAGTDVGAACDLLTKADVQAALGENVGDPEGVSIGTQPLAPGISAMVSSCEFIGTSGAKSVTVGLYRVTGSSSAQV